MTIVLGVTPLAAMSASGCGTSIGSASCTVADKVCNRVPLTNANASRMARWGVENCKNGEMAIGLYNGTSDVRASTDATCWGAAGSGKMLMPTYMDWYAICVQNGATTAVCQIADKGWELRFDTPTSSGTPMIVFKGGSSSFGDCATDP